MENGKKQCAEITSEAETGPCTGESVAEKESHNENVSENGLGVVEKEYPQYLSGNVIKLPEEVKKIMEPGMRPIDALRLYDLRQTKRLCLEQKRTIEADRANAKNRAASVGSLTSNGPSENDYFTPDEWDGLPPHTKKKLIRNGRIYEFMKKWGKKK